MCSTEVCSTTSQSLGGDLQFTPPIVISSGGFSAAATRPIGTRYPCRRSRTGHPLGRGGPVELSPSDFADSRRIGVQGFVDVRVGGKEWVWCLKSSRPKSACAARDDDYTTPTGRVWRRSRVVRRVVVECASSAESPVALPVEPSTQSEALCRAFHDFTNGMCLPVRSAHLTSTKTLTVTLDRL
jgi:hypothetical protein